MENNRERHVRQIVERANKDTGSTMKVRRTASGAPSSARKPSASSATSRGGAKPSPETVKRVVRPSSSSGNNTTATKSTRATSVPKPTEKPKSQQLREAREKEKRDAKKQNARVWIGVGFIFVAGVLLLSCLSYFKYWQQDASLAHWDELFKSGVGLAKNWCGRLGAILGELFVGRWFGVFGLLSGVYFLFLSIKIFRIDGLKLRRSLRSTLVLMFLGSIVLGHFMGTDTTVFGSGMGGALGIWIANWLEQTLGSEGTSMLLILSSLCALYYVNAGWFKNIYGKVRGWQKRYSEYNRLRAESARLRNEKLAQENAARRAELDVLRAANAAKIATQTPINKPITESNNDSPFKDINPDAFAAEPLQSAPIEPIIEQTVEQTTTQPEQIEQNELQVEQTPLEEPIQSSAPLRIRRFNETVELDNGQSAVVLGYNDDNSFNFLYLDRAAVAAGLVELSKGVESSFVCAKPEVLPIEEDDFDDLYTIVDQPSVEKLVSEPHIEKPAEPLAQPTFSTAPPVDFKKDVKVLSGNESEPDLVVEQVAAEVAVDDTIINQMELYDPTLELRNYKKPLVELLTDHTRKVMVTDEELLENKNRILYTLGTFGIKIDKIEATIGPTVTLYEIVPAPGVRISKIKNLEDDIALSLAALGIRIIAPIPGKGTIGIEVPNKDKEIVSMYSVIKSAKFQEFKGALPVAIGKTIQNETFVFDLAKMPHLLVAGATGQGKSVGLNAIITSLLYKKHPSELKFVLVDPKKVELTPYSRLEKHFLAKLPDADEAIITDTQRVIFTLNSICIEMDARYDLLKDASVRSIAEYNDKFTRRRLNPNKGHRFLPYFVVVIDEFADLIMTAGREVETPIARIAQLARAVGIHLIIATQRPTTNIITGVIKANFPARIAFRVTSQIDSRTILDQTGANQLIGLGDMLISTGNETTRVQCAFIDTPEVNLITEHIGNQQGYAGAYELPEYQPEGNESNSKRDDDGKRDPLFAEVARYVVDNQSGSTSTVQRKFSIGFNRAGRIIDQLEGAGIVGRQEGSKPRQVLIQDVVTLENIIDKN